MDSQIFTEERLKDLNQAIEQSEKLLNGFRSKRHEAYTEYLGRNYSQNVPGAPNPVNLLWLWTKIHMQSLAARQPRVMASTAFTEFKPSAANLELALDKVLRDIKFGNTLQMTVMEAIFGMGMVYIGLNHNSQVTVGAQSIKTGRPFADPIFLDEAIFDMTARTPDQMQFIGHSYLIPVEEFESCGLFNDKVKLTVAEKSGIGVGGQERSEAHTTGGAAQTSDYKKYYRLRNLWLPLDGPNGVVVVIEDRQDAGPPSQVLRETEWNGPEGGPYRTLRFNEVPGNLMPLPPVANIIDLHRFQNSIFRKLENQARNTKTVMTYEGAAREDAERVAASDDLDIIQVNSNQKIQERQFNAVDQRVLALNLMIRDQFSWFGGNLDSLGGLAAQSKTVGQDAMLTESASKQVADMQRAVVDFTTDVIRDLAWWMWTDPLIHIPLTKRVKDTSIEINTEFSERTRKGDFLDYNITIDAYSMQHSSPEKKLASIQNIISNVVLPLQPVIEAQGMTIDARALVKTVGKLSDTPELYEIITALDAPVRPDSGPVGEAGGKAPVTTRNYVRENRSAPTRPGRDNAMMQTLLGGGVQGAEMESAANA